MQVRGHLAEVDFLLPSRGIWRWKSGHRLLRHVSLPAELSISLAQEARLKNIERERKQAGALYVEEQV